MKQTIFFDLGNVLIFFDHHKMCCQVADYTGLTLENTQKIMLKYGDLYERGGIDSQTIYQEFCKITHKALHFETLMYTFSNIFQPNDPVISIALQLKEKGHRLFLLSNTCEPHFTFALSQFPFLKQFDGYVLSYKVRARKPEKEIYEKALEIAGCQNKECFYTDDLLPYIETARLLNIDAEQYTTPDALTHHLFSRGIL